MVRANPLRLICLIAGLTIALPAWAQEARIAVAANFTAPAEELAAAFAAQTGQRVEFSFGATAQLYAQVSQGAPFDAFLSADAATPARMIAEGLAREGSDFTYAFGRLVLFSTEADRVSGPESLSGDFTHLAIAEPGAAPYGAAAMEVIGALGLIEVLEDRLVIGQNITQAFQFVQTGNAEMGFVALSQVIGFEGGSRWEVEPEFHAPIAQDAVLLSDNETAAEFLEFITSDAGRQIIARYGYGFEAP